MKQLATPTRAKAGSFDTAGASPLSPQMARSTSSSAVTATHVSILTPAEVVYDTSTSTAMRHLEEDRPLGAKTAPCHGLSIACLIGNRVSPLVRCDNSSYTSCCTLTGLSLHSVTVYIYIAPFVYSYSISSILQFFLHTRCSQTGTVMSPVAQDCSHLLL
jgi:hypothetical protein